MRLEGNGIRTMRRFAAGMCLTLALSGVGAASLPGMRALAQEELTEQGSTETGDAAEAAGAVDSLDTESGLGTETEDGVGVDSGSLPNGKSVYNVLLIGSDRRNESWNGNSDVMIVLSVNEHAERLTLTSFMRDLYADIPGYGVHKLNYAYAAGGAGTLIDTLQDNYNLSVDNYAVVDFETMADIVDLVGGVEMEISEGECKWLNNYLNSMNAQSDFLPGAGTYVLNGNQAVAFMRIRYVGNNDYERTQRQRDVLSVLFDSIQELDAEELLQLAGRILLDVKHDIAPDRLVKVLALLPQLQGYELAESRVPYDGLFTSQNEMLVPDFDATVERLHEELYGE